MALDSLLASLKRGVTEVAGVQASSSDTFACNPAPSSKVAEVSVQTGHATSVTRETSLYTIEVSPEPLSTGASTLETPVTREILNSENDAPMAVSGETALIAPMTGDQEQAIQGWLALIEETDPATIAEVIEQCQRDLDARARFLSRVTAELSTPDPFPDDRRCCSQCLNLRGRVCAIAKPGGLVSANRGYAPPADTLQRCAGYLPTNDTNQQPGGERWPGI